jgi:hypothetical protein
VFQGGAARGGPFRDRVVGIVKVAEHPRFPDTGLDTGGLLSSGYPVGAEITLVHTGTLVPKVVAEELLAALDIVVGDGIARIVGASHRARSAAHAECFVHHHNAVVQLIGGAGWTDRHARRVRAMIAQPREKAPRDSLRGANLFVVHIGAPLVVPYCGLVFHCAGGHAGVAADASIEIDDHGIARHATPPLSLTFATRMVNS